MPKAERRFSFFREGQPLDTPAGWLVYDEKGNLLRTEWNLERHPSDLEKALDAQD